jgi:hypothetical protein
LTHAQEDAPLAQAGSDVNVYWGLGVMEKRARVEELARRLCRELYELTDGQPNKWRHIIGGDLMHSAMSYAIWRGWLEVDSESIRVGLTDEGLREVRKTLS